MEFYYSLALFINKKVLTLLVKRRINTEIKKIYLILRFKIQLL